MPALATGAARSRGGRPGGCQYLVGLAATFDASLGISAARAGELLIDGGARR